MTPIEILQRIKREWTRDRALADNVVGASRRRSVRRSPPFGGRRGLPPVSLQTISSIRGSPEPPRTRRCHSQCQVVAVFWRTWRARPL